MHTVKLILQQSNDIWISQESGHILVWCLLIIMIIGGGFAGYWYFYPHTAPTMVRSYLTQGVYTMQPVYKWQDDQGRWQMSDHPPANRSYETVLYRRDANVMPPGK